MKHPVLPDENTPRRLPFYLAMEEWVARCMPAADYFFAWRVEPTVICGRNQDMQSEVDLDYCSAHGIDVVRRRSGGGCVYADMNNWMFSYITPTDEICSTFSRYTSLIASMLASLGFDAHANGRNDIFIGSRKVSGNAFYHLPGRSIVHGTMLCDIDAERMSRAITPSRSKLEAKGVKSVPARVTSLSAEGLGMSVADFGDYAVRTLCSEDDIVLSSKDIADIEVIEQAYYDPAFLRGHQGRVAKEQVATLHRHARFDGVGEFDAEISLDSSHRIKSLNISGDFFVTGDVEGAICRPLLGAKFSAEGISAAGVDPSAIIPGLSVANLVRLLIVEE